MDIFRNAARKLTRAFISRTPAHIIHHRRLEELLGISVTQWQAVATSEGRHGVFAMFILDRPDEKSLTLKINLRHGDDEKNSLVRATHYALGYYSVTELVLNGAPQPLASANAIEKTLQTIGRDYVSPILRNQMPKNPAEKATPGVFAKMKSAAKKPFTPHVPGKPPGF
jgi:hypothetical protein